MSSERFYYDGQEMIEQNHWASSAETAKKLMVYGERLDELLEYIDIDASPDKYYYAHADMLGSVMMLASETGAINESYRYKEFGETTIVDAAFAKLTTADSPAGSAHGFAGMRNDLGNVSSFGDNWYDSRRRVMRPDAGRYIERWLGGDVAAGNLYGYVDNRPLIGVAPGGQPMQPRRADDRGGQRRDPIPSSELQVIHPGTHGGGNPTSSGGGKYTGPGDAGVPAPHLVLDIYSAPTCLIAATGCQCSLNAGDVTLVNVQPPGVWNCTTTVTALSSNPSLCTTTNPNCPLGVVQFRCYETRIHCTTAKSAIDIIFTMSSCHSAILVTHWDSQFSNTVLGTCP